MASSGSFNTTGYDGRYLTFAWSVKSQSIENNASVISWTLKGAGTGGSSWYRSGNFKVVINGSTVYSSATRIQLYNGTLVASGNVTIPHNSDGTKSFSASAEAGIYTVAVNCRGSASFTLPTINRYASITSVSNFTDEGNPKINFSNPNNSKLKLTLKAGSYTITRDNVTATNSYTFNLTEAERNSLRSQTPNSNSISVTYGLGTYIGSSVAKTETKNATMSITNANPTIGTITYEDNNATTVAITNDNQNIIRNKSTVSMAISSLTSKKSATLKSCNVNINGVDYPVTVSGSSMSNISVNIGTINSSITLYAHVTLTDSRDNVIESSIPIYMLDWVKPTAIIKVARENNFYNETDLYVNGLMSGLDGKNVMTIQYQYKKVSDSTYSALATMQDEETVTLNLDNAYQWNIKVIISDLLGSNTYNVMVDVGIPIIFYDRKLKATGFNCLPDKANSVMSEGLALDDLIYIGSEVLYDEFITSASGSTTLLGSYNYQMLDGLFTGIDIPNNYERAYRITAQVSTQNDNYVSVSLNNFTSNELRTWSADTMRSIISTVIFKESDIALEPTYGYTSRNGTNLSVNNTSSYEARVRNITLHGYLVKKSTSLNYAPLSTIN